jgi:DNA-binding NarL/FixJ family response regulator
MLRKTAPAVGQKVSMLAIAIFSADPVLRGSLEGLVRADPAIAIAGIVDQPSALLQMIGQSQINAVLTDVASLEQWAVWEGRHKQPAFVVLGDGTDENRLDLLNIGARAILPRTADSNEIVAAIKAVAKGYVILRHEFVAALLTEKSAPDESLHGTDADRVELTPRELEVLAAMADGASNKAIARRLGISFHTAKFHVAAILAKLDADSRTEAVTKAAQAGLVML